MSSRQRVAASWHGKNISRAANVNKTRNVNGRRQRNGAKRMAKKQPRRQRGTRAYRGSGHHLATAQRGINIVSLASAPRLLFSSSIVTARRRDNAKRITSSPGAPHLPHNGITRLGNAAACSPLISSQQNTLHFALYRLRLLTCL